MKQAFNDFASKRTTKMPVLLLVVFLVSLFVVLSPFAVAWALGVVLGYDLPYDLRTWSAIIVLMAALKLLTNNS